MIMMAMMKSEIVYDNRRQRKAHDNVYRYDDHDDDDDDQMMMIRP